MPLPRPAKHLDRYHTDLVVHDHLNPDDHRHPTNRAQDAHWYGALVAGQADLTLDPHDDEGGFAPAIDVGYGEAAQRVAQILADDGTVIPGRVAEELAREHDDDELAFTARSLKLVDWEAPSSGAVEAMLVVWAELAEACARSWLRGDGFNPDAVFLLDGEFSRRAVDRSL